MEQGTASQPNLASLDRLTGTAVFFPLATPLEGIHCGDIEMHALSFNPQREHFVKVAGRDILLGSDDTIAIAPVLSIEGRQFHSAILPLLLLGTRNANLLQSYVSAGALTLTARLGKTFNLGALNLRNVVVNYPGGIAIPDVDYFLEANKGLLRFPEFPPNIADGDSITVSYQAPALAWESYAPCTQLDLEGTLQLYEMDTAGVKALWTMPGIITADSLGDGDPSKHRKWKLRYALTNLPALCRRAGGSSVLTYDDGSPVIFDDSTGILT